MKDEKLKLRIEYVLFRNIEESPVNAQEMSDKDFNRLVKNIKKDGILTTAPLLMDQPSKNKFMCVSGHHRIRAAIKAGLDGAHCFVMDEVDESTRVRIQLSHNDIHGSPNLETLSYLQSLLSDMDIELVDKQELDGIIKEAQETSIEVPVFKYINICLLEKSRERFVDILENISTEKDDINWLVGQEEYEHLRDLLTYAFDKGFRTPGQAFGIFMDIVDNHKDEIER